MRGWEQHNIWPYSSLCCYFSPAICLCVEYLYFSPFCYLSCYTPFLIILLLPFSSCYTPFLIFLLLPFSCYTPFLIILLLPFSCDIPFLIILLLPFSCYTPLFINTIMYPLVATFLSPHTITLHTPFFILLVIPFSCYTPLCKNTFLYPSFITGTFLLLLYLLLSIFSYCYLYTAILLCEKIPFFIPLLLSFSCYIPFFILVLLPFSCYTPLWNYTFLYRPVASFLLLYSVVKKYLSLSPCCYSFLLLYSVVKKYLSLSLCCYFSPAILLCVEIPFFIPLLLFFSCYTITPMCENTFLYPPVAIPFSCYIILCVEIPFFYPVAHLDLIPWISLLARCY